MSSTIVKFGKDRLIVKRFSTSLLLKYDEIAGLRLSDLSLLVYMQEIPDPYRIELDDENDAKAMFEALYLHLENLFI